MHPQIQVRTQWFSGETWVSFLLRADAIQALVVAKYLPKSRLAVSSASMANVLT